MAWSWWRRMAAVAWKYAGADSQAIAAAVRAAEQWGVDDPEARRDRPRAAERRVPPRRPDESGT